MAEDIIITKKNGSRVPVECRHTATTIESATQNWGVNGQETVSLTVVSSFFPKSFEIGDVLTLFGRDYRMNRLPIVEKTGFADFKFTLEFEGVQYDLLRATYDLTVDTTTNVLQDVQGDTLTGSLKRFMSVLIANANRVFPGKWRLGSCPDTIGDKTLTFGESDNCLSVLQNLCSKSNFNCEFQIVKENGVYVINLAEKIGQVLPYTFSYGRGNGLYELTRGNVSSANIVTRLKVYGSSENITMKYRADRLCLPGKSKGQSFIEKADAIAKYGVFEGRKDFNEIKPTFTGRITSVIGGNVLQFVDTAFPFDINEKEADGKTTKYLIPGVPAKIHFNTGNLAGYEFEIAKYDHATHTFTVKKITDERGSEFPSASSSAFQFAVGNEYKILDVAYPKSIEEQAEQRLAEEANKYYDQNCQPRVQYGLSVTPEYIEKMVDANSDVVVNPFAPGDYLHIVDDDIEVDKSIRIKSFTRNVLNPYEYQLTVSDLTVTTSIENRLISEATAIDKILSVNNLKDPVRARSNWRSTREVLDMVFDPDGDYYTEKIKPQSIDTMALSVGAKSMQFGLKNTIFQPNYNGNKNVVKVQGGVLTHYTINEDSARSWTLADTQVTLKKNEPYYIYAKCSKSDSTGSIVFLTDQKKTDVDPNFYYFGIGIVNSVDPETNVRSIALTYGFTMVNGRFIKTGRIESADGKTYFDLDNSEIGGRIVFNSNGQEKTLEELGAESLETKDYINNTLPGILDEIQTQLDGRIEQFFETYDPTLQNKPASDWTTDKMKETHLGDLFYNTTSGAVFRFVIENGYYKWMQLSDSEAAKALALAQDALNLAKTKNQIFNVQPYTPYQVGDLWVQGGNGDIFRCKNARQSGAFASSDWEKASKYTDDTVANQAKQDAQEAIKVLSLINSDGYVSPTEKKTLEQQKADVIEEQKQIDADAGKYGVSTDIIKSYDDATNLAIDTLTYYTSATPEFIVVNKEDKSNLEVPAFVYISEYYAARTVILNEIASLAKQMSDDAIADANAAKIIADSIQNQIDDIKTQIDKSITTWFYDPVPTLNNEPAVKWITNDEKKVHLGDLYYSGEGKAYRFQLTEKDKYLWQVITDVDLTKALADAKKAQDTADGKRRVFVDTPFAPYDVGDLWVNATYERGSVAYKEDLLRCRYARKAPKEGQEPLFFISDWELATKYTDDTSLNEFIDGLFNESVNNIINQIDGKVESWFQTTDPDASWEKADKKKHVGDMWHNPADNKLLFYVHDNCNAFTALVTNGKCFYKKNYQPNAGNAPEYSWNAQQKEESVGALFYDSLNEKLYRYSKGINPETEEVKYFWYDLDVENIIFVVKVLDSNVGLHDGARIFTTRPSSYAVNDLFITKDEIAIAINGRSTYKVEDWTVTANDFYFWQRSYDQNAIDAYEAASKAQDTADGKRRTFVEQPYPPYDIGDLWVDGKELRRCQIAKVKGEQYAVNDWVIAVQYDNTKTVIDGGLITSGTIQVAGDEHSILAGMTGAGTTADSIRFWAGASFENRASAPYRVMQDGSVVMTKATVEGIIKATSGLIGGFEIAPGRIGVEETPGSYNNNGFTILESLIKFSKVIDNSTTYAAIGTSVLPLSAGYPCLAKFMYEDTSGSANSAVAMALKCRPNVESTWYTQRALEIDGNTYSIGKSAIFDDGYIGQAFTDIVCEYIGITHNFYFKTVATSLLGMDLPTRNDIQKIVDSSKPITFDLILSCDPSMTGTINLRSRYGAQMYDSSGKVVNAVELNNGDALRLRYCDGKYIKVAWNW